MKRPYAHPVVTRIRIEDKQVVAMSACNSLLENPTYPNSRVEGDNVVDQFGNPLLTYDPSL
jgi:hypothetical protein